MQKEQYPEYREEISAKYRVYAPYKQARGADQKSSISSAEVMKPRTELLVAELSRSGMLNDSGRHLDYGCGNGVLLRTLSSLPQAPRLVGSDIGAHFAAEIRAIKGVENFLPPDVALLPASNWDVIWALHLVEHLVNPVQFLRQAAEALHPDGRIVIQVPWFERNPFDLAIADHVSHFRPETLLAIVKRAGLYPEWGPHEVVNRELTLIARRKPGPQLQSIEGRKSLEAMENALGVLSAWQNLASTAPIPDGWSVMGSSISAAWLCRYLQVRGLQNGLMLDDDPDRQGQSLNGLPILAPEYAPKSNLVMLPFMGSRGRALSERLATLGLRNVSIDSQGKIHYRDVL